MQFYAYAYGIRILQDPSVESQLIEDFTVESGGVTYIDGRTTLERLTAWLGTNSTDPLRPFDHAMLFSR